MDGTFFAKSAIFVELDPVGIVLFVFCCVVIALFALCALERNPYVLRFNTVLRKVAK